MKTIHCPVDRPLYNATTPTLLEIFQARPAPDVFAELWVRFGGQLRERVQKILLQSPLHDLGWHDVEHVVLRIFWEVCSETPIPSMVVFGQRLIDQLEEVRIYLEGVAAYRKDPDRG